ncbi:threonine synthase [Candidatus Woesearchaeota archaeon]|nr:threonine synthase [Candidatus Woesearchaeota archaeon]
MHVKHIQCIDCGKIYNKNKIVFHCNCGGSLDVIYDYQQIKKKITWQLLRKRPFNHWRYREFFPVTNNKNIISIGEGGTPLVKSKNSDKIYFKLEGLNLTGSFKDRGTTVEISKAKEFGVKKVACASTGNMGASVAAYCARAGIKAEIFLPKNALDTKIQQIKNHGAKTIIVKGHYTEAEKKACLEHEKKGFYLMGDYPYRGEGEKSVAFEIIDKLKPDYIICPVGNATLISAIWKALKEMKICGLVQKLPRLVAVQAKTCSPVVNAFNMKKEIKEVKNPKTIATAIACGYPIDGHKAINALKESKGIAISVSDAEILKARRELASQEGIDAEPSGAVAYAGLKKLKLPGIKVVIVSGNGLKDLKNI